MIYELDKETIDFICKHKLTLNQFAICLLIHKKDGATIIRLNIELGVIGDCMIPVGKGSDGKTKYKKELVDLIDREFIETVHPVHGYEIDNLKVTAKFTDEFITPLALAHEEFFEAYPKTIYVNGIEYPARSCDFDEMRVAYTKAIKGSVKKHKLILASLESDKQTSQYAKVNIMNYIGGRIWENNQNTTTTKSKLV